MTGAVAGLWRARPDEGAKEKEKKTATGKREERSDVYTPP